MWRALAQHMLFLKCTNQCEHKSILTFISANFDWSHRMSIRPCFVPQVICSSINIPHLFRHQSNVFPQSQVSCMCANQCEHQIIIGSLRLGGLAECRVERRSTRTPPHRHTHTHTHTHCACWLNRRPNGTHTHACTPGMNAQARTHARACKGERTPQAHTHSDIPACAYGNYDSES